MHLDLRGVALIGFASAGHVASGTVFRDVGRHEAQGLREWFGAMSRTAGTDTLMGFFEGIARDDDRHLLGSVATPTLVVTSGLGREVPSDVGLYLRAHIAESCLVELPGADHFVFATRPRLVNELLAQFLFATPEPL
ncbi:alpha/beta hydrolase [Mycobacterium sp.]|jgi:non-heme chloroperoxidase|uniref:alpha/beta fold hydrolase n=1 Tax=Mycobacterium sp. TaxID=1785 RepID=UPI003342D5F3|nr:uncharacterized protein [Mycobacterium sp.]